MRLARGGDRRKMPAVAEFRAMTAVELRAVGADPFGHGWFRALDGTAREWRVNGRLQVWTRDPARFRLPAKYGWQECFAWVNGPDGEPVCEGGFVVPLVQIGDWDK